jgi:hypothetical protein
MLQRILTIFPNNSVPILLGGADARQSARRSLPLPAALHGKKRGRAPLRVRRYHPDRPIENEVYDSNVTLELRDEFELRPGESLERDGYTDVLDWARVDAPGFVLRLHSESVGNYEWAFDRETRAPKGVTVLDSLWSGTANQPHPTPLRKMSVLRSTVSCRVIPDRF